MAPILRLLCAVTLLAAYYCALFPGRLAPRDRSAVAAAALTDSDLLRDIDASEVAYAAGRYADALEPTRRLTEKMPTQALYLDRLAHIHHGLGNRIEEARSLERLFAVSATPADACPRLGQAYEAVNDAPRALSAFERCAGIEPDNPDALLMVGRAYQSAGRAADARRVLEQALVIAPNYPDLYLLLGVRHYADGDVAMARQHFERFLALAPERQVEVSVWLERTNTVTR